MGCCGVVRESQTASHGALLSHGPWRDLLKRARSGKMPNKCPEDWLDPGMLEGWAQKGGASEFRPSRYWAFRDLVRAQSLNGRAPLPLRTQIRKSTGAYVRITESPGYSTSTFQLSG